MRPLDMGQDPRDLRAVIDLAGRRQVLFRAPHGSEESEALAGAGLLPLVSELHCLQRLDSERAARLPRRGRAALNRQLDLWRAAALEVSLTPGWDADTDELVATCYYPILVPRLYARGESPFGTHNEARFRRLLARSLVAVVQDRGVPAGIALLEPRDLSPLKGSGLTSADLRRAVSGSVTALAPQLGPVRRAWTYVMGEALAMSGWRVLSLGADTGWVDAGYAGVVLDKLSWCDAPAWLPGDVIPYFSLEPPEAADRSALSGLAVTHREGKVEVSSVGVPAPTHEALERRIRRSRVTEGNLHHAAS